MSILKEEREDVELVLNLPSRYLSFFHSSFISFGVPWYHIAYSRQSLLIIELVLLSYKKFLIPLSTWQVRGALETLVSALTPIERGKGSKNEVQPVLMNTDLLSREPDSINLLLSLLVRVSLLCLELIMLRSWAVYKYRSDVSLAFMIFAVRGRFLCSILHSSNSDGTTHQFQEQVLFRPF